jgi:hypothetical protein
MWNLSSPNKFDIDILNSVRNRVTHHILLVKGPLEEVAQVDEDVNIKVPLKFNNRLRLFPWPHYYLVWNMQNRLTFSEIKFIHMLF